MPLKFVLGPSGSGKTYQLYKNVIAESKAHPEENFIVLVPEQFTMQTQKDLVTMHDRHAIMNIDAYLKRQEPVHFRCWMMRGKI